MSCPICGAEAVGEIIEAVHSSTKLKQHRCKQRTLDAIDRGLNTERTESDRRTLAGRLAEGFRMMSDNYEG